MNSGQGWMLALILLVVALSLFGAVRIDWTDASAILNYFGRLTGIVGLALLLLAAALITRVPGFDRHFGGLTKLWNTHHLLGAGSLLLLMAHPLLLALAATDVSMSAAIALLFPEFSNWQIWSGWLALILMMIFLAPSFSFFGRPEYQRWKYVHRLAGPAVILALVHAFQYGRTMPAHAERWLWLLLAVLAVGAVLWRFVFSRRITRHKYQVEQVVAVANNLVELVLKPQHHHLKYQAGQFVYLTPYDKTLSAGYGEEHPYTVSSSPDEPVLRIAIKDLGDASRAIQTIQPGSLVTIEGPYGDFFPVNGNPKQLWIAGGIGITPFLGRARHLLRSSKPVDVCLIYCVQDEARTRFLDELEDIAKQLEGFQVSIHYFYRMGPLDRDFLHQHCSDITDRDVFICGPQPLNHLARRLISS
ncbi:MAG: ferric reductase-like transmembrane domain-containing protein [Pseudomonadota bacterium]